jgi:hypothetical protein
MKNLDRSAEFASQLIDRTGIDFHGHQRSYKPNQLTRQDSFTGANFEDGVTGLRVKEGKNLSGNVLIAKEVLPERFSWTKMLASSGVTAGSPVVWLIHYPLSTLPGRAPSPSSLTAQEALNSFKYSQVAEENQRIAFLDRIG